MDANAELAPSVVAVVVVHEPDAGFDEVLDALAVQDYPNVKTLFLVTGEAADIPTRIGEVLPDAFVRVVAGNPGFGPTANEVMRLVEGDNGFFMIMHDDVALEPNSTRLLVEELYRSNAGIVGPKLVEWDDATLLQHVGLGVDRFGEIDALVEPGELDQEQHDAVRDVFALPSACVLVRADLFRALGGFDSSVSYYGEDLDLCWRAHLSGARVVVVPTARARHRERLRERRPDLPHRLLQAQHRARTVATLTGGLRLPLLFVQMLLISIMEMVVGLFTGHLGEAFASFRATLGLIPRIASITRRRREIAKLRQVPYREVAGLQLRGSARLASYLRTRELQHMSVDHSAIGTRRFTRNAAGQLATWLTLIALVVIGSRTFILHGVPSIGEYLHFPASARHLLRDYWSGWLVHGLGQTAPTPTGVGILGTFGLVSLGNMGLFHTVAVIGWLPFGYYGAWRLMSLFPSSRARIVGLIAYAAVPLPYTALGAGRWSVVAAYGAAPWIVHLLRTMSRIEPALTAKADADVVDARAPRRPRDQIRALAQLVLLTAIVTAFVPTFAGTVVFIGLALAVATVLARGSAVTALALLAWSVAGAVLAFALNLPWVTSLFGTNGWDTFVGAPAAASSDLTMLRTLRFAVGPDQLGILAVALWLPVVAAPLLARGWRLTWAARGAVLAIGSLAVCAVDINGSLPFRLPEVGLLLAPAAVGIAISAACAAAAFEQDVQGGSFGWRQPVGVWCGAAIIFGAIPAVAAAADGHWATPSTVLLQPAEQFAQNPAEGNSRTLYIGDARVMPFAGWRLDAGGRSDMSYGLVDDGPLSIDQHWAGLPSTAEDGVSTILRLMSQNSTARIGRLLAPYAVRYVVIPLVDGVESTNSKPVAVPAGLIASLSAQLDLRLLYTPPNYVAFENMAWIPTRSILSPAAARASDEAGSTALAAQDIAGSTPVLVGMPDRGPGRGPVAAGVLHQSVPYDQRWTLTVGDAVVPSSIAFGATTAFHVPAAGAAVLEYHTDSSRHVAVLVQLAAWIALCFAASRTRWSWLRRRRGLVVGDDGPVLSLGVAGGAGPTPWVVEPDVVARDDDSDADQEPSLAVSGDLFAADAVEEPES